MNPYIINTDFIQIKWYSIFIVVGIILSSFLIMKEGKKFDLKEDFVINIMFWAIIIGIIGARLYYVVFNLDYYSQNLSEIYKIWKGGIAIHGAIIFGLITILIYCKKYKVNSLRFLDIVVPALLLSQALGRWGNFFNSEAYGIQTTYAHLKNLYIPEFIINGMNINGIYYTPTFLYESLWCIVGFIILLIIRKLKYTKVGYQTSFYLMWYSVGRFFVESYRMDSLMLGNIRVAQLVSIIMFIIGFILLLVESRKPKLESLYNDKNEKLVAEKFD